MWITLIFILAIAMIVGPVLMMKPSRRTQQLADLRAQATQMGLQVRLGHLPGVADGEEIAIYTRSWPSFSGKAKAQTWLLIKRNYSHEIHYADHWDWQGEDRPAAAIQDHLKALLDQLPDSVVAIEATSGGIGCYWPETGGVKTLETINHWLDDVITRAALPTLVSNPAI